MTDFTRIVPLSLCLASVLIVSGCSENAANTSATKVQPASKQTTAADTLDPESAAQVASAGIDATTLPAGTKVNVVPDPSVVSIDEVDPKSKQPVNAPPANSVVDTHDGHDHADHDHADHDHDHARPQNVSPQSGEFIVQAVTNPLEIGDIPTNDTRTAVLKLVNTGNKPMTLVNARASCGCTAMRIQPNTEIPAGETLEIDVQMQGGNKPGPLSGKTVTVIIDGQPDLVVPIKANAVSFVVVEPAEIDPYTMTDGKIKLRAIDNQPFRIMSIHPADVGQYDDGSKVEHEITLSWDKYRELGVMNKTAIYLDHPKCGQVMPSIKWKPEDFRRNTTATNTTRPQPPAPVQRDPMALLEQLVKAGTNDEVTKRLSEGTINLEQRDSTGATPLIIAARHGNVDIIKAFVNAEAELEASDNAGRTPLMWAAQSKNVKAVQTLLDLGASPTIRDTLGGTALSWAAGMGDSATVKLLLEAGAEVDVVGSITGWTPLMWAAQFGETESVKLLIDAGAEINAQDVLQGTTPLMQAARTGKLETIKLLVERGADLEATDRMGHTALLTAASSSGADALRVQMLLDAGADPQAKNNQGYNALELARKRTDTRADGVIKLLEPLLGEQTPAVASDGADAQPPKPGAE